VRAASAGLYAGAMRHIFVLVCVVACWGLAGCSEAEAPCPLSEIPELIPVQGLLVAGKPERMSVMPFAIAGCKGADPSQLFSVSAEVSGPDLLPLPSEATLGKSGKPTTVDFTPVQPGAHHVLVAFNNVGGVHQRDLLAAVDQSTLVTPLSVAKPCESLERTSKGTWICDQEALRNGVVEKQFAPAQVAVSGDVVWVADRLGVQRYVDTGEALKLTASLAYSLPDPLFLLPSEDELVVLHHSNALQRIVFTDPDQLVSTGTSSWEAPSLLAAHSTVPSAMLLRDGSHLAVVSHNKFIETSSAFYAWLCPYELVSGAFVRTSESCQTVSGVTVGFESNVLWMAGDDSRFSANLRILHRWVWSQGKIGEQAVLDLGTHLDYHSQPIHRSSAVPVIRSREGVVPRRYAAVAWSAEQGKLLLQYLGQDFLSPAASSSLWWEPDPALTQKATLRPSLP
jgi:hypothetical protein